MIKTISIKAWDQNIAIVAEIQSEIVLDLEDIKFNVFSPLKFEETIQAREHIHRNDNVDSIGILSDSISGAYGKGYFNKYFLNTNGESPSLMDRLSFIGSDSLGVLEFNPSSSSEIDEDVTFSLMDFKELSMDVYEGNSSHRLAMLIAKSNSGAGGAKAKAVVQYNPDDKNIHLSQINSPRLDGYIKCILKFNNAKNDLEIQHYNDELKLEYIYYLLAKEVGINISDSWLEVDDSGNYYFITKRFDVYDNDIRVHMHSLAGILSHDASPFSLGYESLFRVGNMLGISKADKEQMFKTMVFNIVFANRDDHSRNFSFLMDENYSWSFSPSYDLTYSASNNSLAWHQLTIDKKPTSKVRGLGIIKIAKLCDIEKPLEVFADMIELKNNRLLGLALEYGIETMSEMIFEDTKEIDKTFGRK